MYSIQISISQKEKSQVFNASKLNILPITIDEFNPLFLKYNEYIIGYIVLDFCREDNALEIYELEILGTYKRQNHGTEILKEIKVQCYNKIATRFFEKNGFVLSGMNEHILEID